MKIIDKTKEWHRKDIDYWLEKAEKEGRNVPVHYFYQDEERTIKEICESYDGDTQIHMFVASKRKKPKYDLEGIPR